MYSAMELRLLESLSWFLVSARDSADLTMAAAEALVAGLDSPALRELAGLPTAADWAEIRVVAETAFNEIGLPYPNMDSDNAQLYVLRVLCRRHVNGLLPARQLTRWAHSNIGHEGSEAAQQLVMLDDDFDEVDWPGGSIASVLADIDAAAREFVASFPRE